MKSHNGAFDTATPDSSLTRALRQAKRLKHGRGDGPGHAEVVVFLITRDSVLRFVPKNSADRTAIVTTLRKFRLNCTHCSILHVLVCSDICWLVIVIVWVVVVEIVGLTVIW